MYLSLSAVMWTECFAVLFESFHSFSDGVHVSSLSFSFVVFCDLFTILMIMCFQFISSDVYGVFGSAFCDFGDTFEVMDPTGEERKEVFIANITKVRALLPWTTVCFLTDK